MIGRTSTEFSRRWGLLSFVVFKLMIAHNIGATVRQAYEIKPDDSDVIKENE